MTQSIWGKARIALEYALKRTGPMSMAPSQLGAFTRSDPSRAHPNLEYHVQPLSLDAFGSPLHRFNAITASVCNLNPTSRGTVHIKTNRFEDAPASWVAITNRGVCFTPRLAKVAVAWANCNIVKLL